MRLIRLFQKRHVQASARGGARREAPVTDHARGSASEDSGSGSGSASSDDEEMARAPPRAAAAPTKGTRAISNGKKRGVAFGM